MKKKSYLRFMFLNNMALIAAGTSFGLHFSNSLNNPSFIGWIYLGIAILIILISIFIFNKDYKKLLDSMDT